MFGFWYSKSNSSFFLILHSLVTLSFTGPKILLRIFLSKERSLFSSVFQIAHVYALYVTPDLIKVGPPYYNLEKSHTYGVIYVVIFSRDYSGTTFPRLFFRSTGGSNDIVRAPGQVSVLKKLRYLYYLYILILQFCL